MRKKAYMLLIALLLFLSLTQSVHAQGYDYVDNNTSNVDGIADIGNHSSFTAQQYGPDSILDTLTEGGISGNIAYENSAESYSATQQSSHNFNYALQKGSGNDRLFVVTVSWEDGQASASVSSLTLGGTAMTKIADVIASGGYSEYISLWYLLDSNLPSDPGSYIIAVAVSEIITREIYVAVAEYSGVRQSAPDDYDTHALTGSGSTAITLTAAADGSVVVAGVGEGGTNALTNTNNINNLQQQILASSGSALGHHINASSGDITVGWNNLATREGMVGAVWQPATNYKLDLEVQWINATHDLPNAELCIYGGTMGSEDIRVDVWTGATWQNLFTDLSSGWNNVSITDILVGSTFTVRFNGGTETGDSSQDSWQIDTTLVHVWGAPPIAIFYFTPSSPYTGETVTFNASTSSDPDGTIANYLWTFGDGTNGTGEIITHTYADNGIYTTTLTVTDNDGLVDTASTNITVLNRPPAVSFTESTETAPTGEPIYFNASSSYDSDGSIVSYFWNFGDGSNATGITVQHVYAEDGTYTVTLTVTDDDGAISSTTATKTVLNRPPVAMFTESVSTVYTGEDIQFNASASYDPDGSIVSCFWTFGDGTNATGSIVSHAYANNGSYIVTLIVTDDDGSTSSETATKMVLNRPPIAVLTESAETIETGEAITFNASSSYDVDGLIVSYFWAFGDGANATETVVSHVYADDGVYTVTLTVTDDDGAIASTSATKTILNKSPIALFTESLETVYTGEVIDFNASASYDPDGFIVGYFWNFGDGSNATGIFATHTYTDNGVYNVTLIVTDNDGATDTVSSAKTVVNRSPVASFTESAETAYIGELITFNASGSYDPDGTIVSYYWDFGDATNATGLIVSHTYSVNGTFTVILTVVDNDGSSNSTSATKAILYNNPPVASFTESTATAYTIDIITFNASSSYDSDGSLVNYFWDFGDGTNATGIVVTHAYVDNGIYTVTLTVTDNLGAIGSSNSIKTILNRSPIASFIESTEAALTGETIYFNASSSYDPDGSIASYFWTFGDGSNATGVAVSHAYGDNGAYTVTVSVTDDDGATTALSATKTILNRPPAASFTESAATLYSSEIVVFNASSSYDPDGTILNYSWDFGDGTNVTGIVVSHSYGDDGIYTVVLTVTDNDGATSNSFSTKTVLNRPPIASFTESATTVYANDIIYLNASSSYDPDGSIVSYFWDFGDWTNASGVVASHMYAENGVYSIKLTAVDNDGATATTAAIKTVLNRSPVALFSESAVTVLTGDTIYFNASGSYDPDGTVANYFWAFGDGMNATGATVDHAYLDNGTYTVTLTVTDNDGGTASATATKTVLNRSPVASFSESSTSVYTSESISFNATASYDPDGSITSYAWNFGDENTTTTTSPVITHAYADDGMYMVTLTVTDDDGATASTSATKTILNRSPVVSFIESAETIYTGETITFNASDSYDPDGSIVSYFWDFGDGTNATGIVLTHSYIDEGNFLVTLSVTDDDGASSLASATKTVLNRLPMAVFTESANTVSTNELITFNGSASYDPDGSIMSYLWDFGDGTNASGITAEHIYADDSVYTVTLTVTDDKGATSSTSATKTVLNRPPAASFAESAETVYTGDSITLNASNSYDSDGTVVSYFWDFGDGTNGTGIIVTHSYADDGAYVVTLAITDDDGAKASTTAYKTVLNRPPVAMFTESATTVLTGQIITFNAFDCYDSDGSIVFYFWDFGDGTNTTGVTVEHVYVDDGIYTVTLTITDDDDTTTATAATKTILNRPPVASFTESAATAYTNDVIYFNASSSYDSDGSIVFYFWTFDDGANATGVTASYAYADDGAYSVILTITDNDGVASTATATKTILNRLPVASFTESASTVLTGEAIYFNASASYDPDGTIVNYFWDFGDGTNFTGATASHAYSDDGTFIVTLTVTDDDGAISSTTATKTILNRSPAASFTESATTTFTGEAIYFNASSSYDPDGAILSYYWDFGDEINTTGITVSHTYTDNGNYSVTLIVTDDDGVTATTMATKTILNRSPVASFTETAETVHTGETITFNASNSFDLDGIIISYTWDFGDGNITTVVDPIVTHGYVDNGTYTVTLTLADDDGATGSANSAKTILNRSPIALFTESAEAVVVGQNIYFNASQSYDPDSLIVSFFWDFGDGTNATGSVVEHAYTDNGIYTITLTITDDDSATTSTSATKTVEITPPVAVFVESSETVYTGEIIDFNASASYDPDGFIVGYFWDFGDGTNATGILVQHAYPDNGAYTASLTVTDDDGAFDTTTSTKTALNRPPAAIFTESTETATTLETIYFNASQSYDLDGMIVSYFWDFGDETNTTGMIVSHAYADNGVYVVMLMVTDDDGATISASSTKTVFNRSPTAMFTESAETVLTGEIIAFDASSSYDPDGVIANYFWDLGDGSNATGATVDHVYADDGTYIVTLTVTDDDGATDSVTSTKTLLNRPPVALFTESAETVYTNKVIQLNASSSYDSDGSITNYWWVFGDGTNTSGMTVTHAYVQEGNYTVTLVVTDNDGTTSSTSAAKTVLNRPPVAIFTESAETVYTGKSITFDASDSYDPDGTIVSYDWNFGDGTTGAGSTIGHAYADDGNYTITLTVTDDDGATYIATSVKTILNKMPIASFTASATIVSTGTVITFDASESYDSDGAIIGYFWNFGDGTNATGIMTTHAYGDNGSYPVRLTVTDDDGATGTSTITVTVLNRSPMPSFTESATNVYTGELITFNASSSYDPDGTIISYFWTFGDGTNATGIAVPHSYADDGGYMVTLAVTDDDGSTNTKTATKTVLNRPPTTLFTESAQSVVVGEVISFNASASYDPDGFIASYFWTFGDGANSTGVLVNHTYSASGVYTVVLAVTDDDGATTSQSSTKSVEITSPAAVFTESAQTVYTGETITFNASASYDPDGTIISYFWTFGDGSNATGIVATHVYTTDGNYTVTLTVTDNDGAPDTANATKIILNRPPTALFTESAQTIYIGQSIMFNASTSFDEDGSIVSYFWDFGDGTNTTGIAVEHSYATTGTYTVTLTVTDDDSDSTSTSAAKTILWNEKPVASFTETSQTMYVGEIVYFNASSSYDLDGSIISHFWDFGDGTNATEIIVDHSYANNGNYTVTLTVTDNVGATSVAIATKMVMNRSPVALFTESATSVYSGEPITFNASSSYDLDGAIVNFFWAFGDGTNSTGATVSHSYANNGTYTVALIITDDDNAYNSTSATKTVLNNPPVATFTESAETIHTSQSIVFNASSSYDPDGLVVTYFWDFGDGTNATGTVVEHTYSINGTFAVTLNVTDEEGGSSMANATKTIIWNEPPTALFTESAETIYQGESITFNASDSYDLDGTIVSYFWTFGDGTNATDIIAEHLYSDHGNYTVTLTIIDNVGETSVISATKTVLNKVPVVTFTESFTSVYTGEIIIFNASASYDPDGLVISYLWAFGDGSTEVGEVVQHSYADDGQYTVTLNLTDNDGGLASASASKTILNRSPVASFTLSPLTAYTGEIVAFNASGSYDVDGLIVGYFWDFGDGQTGYGKVVSHAFADNRLYVIALTVTDDDSATNRLTTKLVILNRSPVASFVESAQTSYIGTPIGFDASGSYDIDGLIVDYSWSFGDGTTATGVTTNHVYLANGTYTVTLTVTDNDRASNSVQATKTILENTLPTASFTESLHSTFTGQAIAFDASTSYDPDGLIATYFWNFGDGSDASGVVVEHAYTNDGSYTVTLTVTDDLGAQDTATATKTVLNRLPVASFSESVETAYAYETIAFDASSSYDSDGSISSYFWDFSDGTNATGEVTGHAYSVNSTFTVTLTVTDNDGGSNSVQATKTILGGLRDVKIVDVIPAVTEIYKHRVLDISVVVTNEGTEIETFNVTLFLSEIHGWHLIEVDGRLAWYSDVENSADFLLQTSATIPADNPTLTFETKYDTENLYDFCFVQISSDEGVTWISLENAYTTYNHALDTEPNIIAKLPGLSGTSTNWPGWRTMSFDLSAYAGQTVLLGFRYMTDPAYAKEGWYVDNVAINGAIILNQDFTQQNPPPLNPIQTLSVNDLAPSTQRTLVFSANTTNIPTGKYSISALASPVQAEIDTQDNFYANGVVEVMINPDVDGDGDVDIFDVVAIASLYGCKEGDARWNPKVDLVEDKVINIFDIVAVASHYGEKIP